jgi:hypothetical protein
MTWPIDRQPNHRLTKIIGYAVYGSSYFSSRTSPTARDHQEREDPVLEFDRAEGVYFFDRQGRRYLDFLSQLFHDNLRARGLESARAKPTTTTKQRRECK